MRKKIFDICHSERSRRISFSPAFVILSAVEESLLAPPFVILNVVEESLLALPFVILSAVEESLLAPFDFAYAPLRATEKGVILSVVEESLLAPFDFAYAPLRATEKGVILSGGRTPAVEPVGRCVSSGILLS